MSARFGQPLIGCVKGIKLATRSAACHQYGITENMDVHSRSHRDQLATENEELRDLCCYLHQHRQRLKQSVHEWKDRYYQLSFKHKYRCCGAISRQRSTELKETAKQVRTWFQRTRSTYTRANVLAALGVYIKSCPFWAVGTCTVVPGAPNSAI